jgi:hypothetical protein
LHCQEYISGVSEAARFSFLLFATAGTFCSRRAGDNTLSALSVEFQERILCRYAATDTPLLDANSGFEPQTFDVGTYRRWQEQLHGPWRLAFHTESKGEAFELMIRILSAERPKKKQVCVLDSNEPLAACLERAQKVIESGGEPFVQPMRPLNALDYQQLRVAYDWSPQLLRDFTRYFNPKIWRSASMWEYYNRRRDPPLFAFLRPAARVFAV